jgi:para-nitrobenzyl esterase
MGSARPAFMIFKPELALIQENRMSTRAQTQYGQVEGETRGAHVVFRGIPFAKPPVGKLRFCAPEAPEPWSGVRAAREFAASAVQGEFGAPGVVAEGSQSEDCLYLNVYTKAVGERRRPVLFWIHGGGFTSGGSSMPIYDGGALCERGDVVVVTINYRLGALGYADLRALGGDRLGAAANLGQLDQLAALRWVQANIERFGGDPNNVTIFGESAGSYAVCSLLVTPAAIGSFHRAIAQSGAALTLATREAAAKAAEGLLKNLGLGTHEVERLWDLPAETIVKAQGTVTLEGGLGRGFAPIVDGDSMPLPAREAIARKQCSNVPFVIGTNRDEMNLFTMPLLRELDKPLDDARAIGRLARDLPEHASHRIPGLLEVYRASRARRKLPHGNRALLGAIQTDARFRMPSILFAEAYRALQPSTFMYLFTYESPAMRGALRSCHALEIPFVFGTLDAPYQDKFAGKGEAVDRLSHAMMDAWLAHSLRGNPTHPSVGDWVPYDGTRRATMVFDTRTALEDAPYEDERAAWNGIF